jgi:hypothetical protein
MIFARRHGNSSSAQRSGTVALYHKTDAATRIAGGVTGRRPAPRFVFRARTRANGAIVEEQSFFSRPTTYGRLSRKRRTDKGA